MTGHRRARHLLASVVVAASVAGCGGGDGDDRTNTDAAASDREPEQGDGSTEEGGDAASSEGGGAAECSFVTSEQVSQEVGQTFQLTFRFTDASTVAESMSMVSGHDYDVQLVGERAELCQWAGEDGLAVAQATAFSADAYEVMGQNDRDRVGLQPTDLSGVGDRGYTIAGFDSDRAVAAVGDLAVEIQAPTAEYGGGTDVAVELLRAALDGL